ncbi:MAG: allantoin racemase [Gammaproteobacteria bacterium]|jgi:allantoin racemase
MRLWYQSVTREGSFPAYRATLGRLLDAAAGPGVSIDVHGIRRQGGTGDQYRYLAFLETVEILENVHHAQQQGYDAFVIGNVFNPGLREAREIADIPIVGLGEAVLHTAQTMGERVGFVSINAKFEPRLNDVLVHQRMLDKVAAIESMQVPSMAALETAGADGAATAELCERFMRAAEATVSAGAEVVIAAGGVVMAIVADQGLFRTPSGAPIVHGVAALIQQAQAAVELRRLMGGVYTSARLTYAKPGQEEIAGFRKAYGQRVYPGVDE